MASQFLQDALKEALEALFRGYRIPNSMGEARDVHVYCQGLPVRQGEDDLEDPALLPEPYIIVRTEGGNAEPDKPMETDVLLVLCVSDDGLDRQGHRDVLRMIQTIVKRFCEDPIVGRRWELKSPIDWTSQDEDTHPYYFGAVRMEFEMTPIYRKEPEL